MVPCQSSANTGSGSIKARHSSALLLIFLLFFTRLYVKKSVKAKLYKIARPVKANLAATQACHLLCNWF